MLQLGHNKVHWTSNTHRKQETCTELLAHVFSGSTADETCSNEQITYLQLHCLYIWWLKKQTISKFPSSSKIIWFPRIPRTCFLFPWDYIHSRFLWLENASKIITHQSENCIVFQLLHWLQNYLWFIISPINLSS